MKSIGDTETEYPSAALILANHPFPLQNDSFYFEIEVLNSGDTGCVEFDALLSVTNL